MPIVKQIYPNYTKVCIGALKYPIRIIDSEIEPTARGFTINLDDYISTYAAIETTTGVQGFDGVNVVSVTTHVFYIRYGVTVEPRYNIYYNNKYYIVLSVENMNEQRLFLKLTTTERGMTEKKASWR